MTVFLIRHGRTLANEQHLYCGSTDLPLSRAGREALANRPPIDVGAAHFITSGMRRCNETLAILFGDVPYEVVRDFREIDFGAFEMKSYEMLKDEPAYQTWLSRDPEINPPPGGESGEQMTRRVLAAYKALESRKENTVIVTHGGVIAAIMASLFPGGREEPLPVAAKAGRGVRRNRRHLLGNSIRTAKIPRHSREILTEMPPNHAVWGQNHYYTQ